MAEISTAAAMLIKTDKMHKRLVDSKVGAQTGLHRTQHIILMRLACRDKLPSQKELAEHLNISPAAVTGILSKLEMGGYISRSIGSDNRYNEITITSKGREIVQKSCAIFDKIDASIFDGFSEKELEDFVFYLKRIQLNINKQMEGNKHNEEMV